MQALYYGGPQKLYWQEAQAPKLASASEALVRPLAVAVCDLDMGIVAGNSPFQPPFQLGHEFAAEVVDVGDDVDNFQPGDLVAVSFQPSCGTCPACHRGHSSACHTASGTPMYGIGSAGGDWGGALSDAVRVPFADAMMIALPPGMNPAMAAGASDNIADGYRAVAPALRARPGAEVLVAGSGSIALYACWWAVQLGAKEVTLASRDAALLNRAEKFGVQTEQVTLWPKRFRTHAITVDCTGEAAGLSAVLSSTEAYGHSTSCSIYFGGDLTIPMFALNMKGIHFVTGRVNAASLLPEVLAQIAKYKLTPETVLATVVEWDDMKDALLNQTFKPIAQRA